MIGEDSLEDSVDGRSVPQMGFSKQDGLSPGENVRDDSLRELTDGALMNGNRRATPLSARTDTAQRLEAYSKKRRIDDISDPLVSLLKSNQVRADRNSVAVGFSGNHDVVNLNITRANPSSTSDSHGPDTIQSAGRQSLDLSSAPDHASGVSFHNPLAQQHALQSLLGFDSRLSLLGTDMLVAQSIRNAQTQSNPFLPNGGASASVARSQGIPRELASNGLLSSFPHHLEDPAMSEFLFNRLASLSSNGAALANAHYRLGQGANSSSIAAEHFLQYEINSLVSGAMTNPTLMRGAHAPRFGGVPPPGLGLSAFSPHLFSGDRASSMSEFLMINSGGSPRSPSVGSDRHFRSSLAALHPSILGRGQQSILPTDPFAASARAALTLRLPTEELSESVHHNERWNSASLATASNASSTVGFPRRTLDHNQMARMLSFPSSQESPLPAFTQRKCVPLSTDEDENWLSEFLCFIRKDLVEVFRASNDDVASRINSKKVVYGQVGIRCRYCAHMPHNERASRSSSFPSSIDRIYQSLTMMIRDHFVTCRGLPDTLKSRFLDLKSRTSQGATDSKRYWIESATKLGMVDTPGRGIWIDEGLLDAGIPTIRSPVGSHSRSSPSESASSSEREKMIVLNDDKPFVSEYIYFLMTLVEKVHLTESERVGNRRSMELGMPGFGCKHCCAAGRKGLCRFFPARRRTLPAKIKDLSDHLRRCTMCPVEVKQKLADFTRFKLDEEPTEGPNKPFFDRVWARLQSREKPE